jgi:hypothetical protein
MTAISFAAKRLPVLGNGKIEWKLQKPGASRDGYLMLDPGCRAAGLRRFIPDHLFS